MVHSNKYWSISLILGFLFNESKVGVKNKLHVNKEEI